MTALASGAVEENKMTAALMQLAAVIVGGMLTIAGGFLSSYLLERKKLELQSRNLALALRGEVSALLSIIEDRGYVERMAQVIQQIEQTQEPFYMPYHTRYSYDRVYGENVDKIGLLREPLPEMVATFYAQVNSLLEDMGNLAEGRYSQLGLPLLLRVYREAQRILMNTTKLGQEIITEIDRQHQARPRRTQRRPQAPAQDPQAKASG